MLDNFEVFPHPLWLALIPLLIVFLVTCYRGDLQWRLSLDGLKLGAMLAGRIRRAGSAVRRTVSRKSRRDRAPRPVPGKRIIDGLRAWLAASVYVLIVGLGVLAPGVTNSGAGCDGAEPTGALRPAPLREIIIAIDATTKFTSLHIEQLLRAYDPLPGDVVTVATFSAYSFEHSLQFELVVEFEQQTSLEEPWWSRWLSGRRQLQYCFQTRSEKSQFRLRQAVVGAMSRPAPALQRSEIINAVLKLGRHLSDMPNDRDKILLLVSDMIEHAPGATVSFYEKQSLRRIDPQQEFNKVRHRVAELRGVQVFVFGGGLNSTREGFRNQDAVDALEEFWRLYIRASNGELVEFGTPLPMKAIK